MAKKHGPNKENLEATRRIFLDIARREFSKNGYYNASTAQIVEESNMARGSLYYHFGDKKGLFAAVYAELMKEMQNEILSLIKTEPDAWNRFIGACLHCLALCTNKETRRIIIDVHTALTYQERVEILNDTLLMELRVLLADVITEGYFAGHHMNTLSLMIFGIISESARSFELATDVEKARTDVSNAFILLMEKARV